MNSHDISPGPPCEFRVARPADVPALAGLVNRAYRPEPGEAGWTHEAHLVAGPRTTVAQVHALLAAPASTLLVGHRQEHVVACVQVEVGSDSSYVGMLAVDPAFQGKGVGTQMLEFAERYAVAVQGAGRLVMTVVSHRKELVSFYLRRGYQLNGRVHAFPAYAGIPKQPGLELVELDKPAPRLAVSGVAADVSNT